VPDWTTLGAAAIAGSAGLGSGLGAARIAYLTGKRQSAVELERIRAENDRLRTQHQEEHLRHRQAVYHDFLDSAHRFHQDAGGTEPLAKPAEAQEWMREFEHRLMAVCLFGTEVAWKAAQRLADVIGDAMEAAPAYEGTIEQRFLEVWQEVIEAMRVDTAPSQDPLDAEGDRGPAIDTVGRNT
jgi:hypothetical protein